MLLHYGFLWKENPPYDVVYFIGDQVFDSEGREFCEGGGGQENAVHYIELLAALGALDFFKRTDLPERGFRQYYCGREVETEESKTVAWEDMPMSRELKNHIIYFTSMAIAYLSFYYPLIKDERFEQKRKLSPWYIDFFSKYELTSEEVKKDQEELAKYFKEYLRWISEIHLSTERELKWLNKEVMKDIAKSIKNGKDIWISDTYFISLLSETPASLRYGYDSVWAEMCRIQAEKNISAFGKFVNLLYSAIKKFCNKNYNLL